MGNLYLTSREIVESYVNQKRDSDDFSDELPSYLDKNGDFIKEKLKKMVNHRTDIFLDLSRSQSREARYIGYSGLLAGDSRNSVLWNAFEDPFYPSRGLVIDSLINENRHKLFNEIFKTLISDPRQIVRDKALRRIKKDFSDIFTFRIENFSPEEQYRLIVFLNRETASDSMILEKFLSDENESLSSRAAYNIQRRQFKELCSQQEKVKSLNLLRYSPLHSFCSRNHPLFKEAFNLIDVKSPPSLQNAFIIELSHGSYNEDFHKSYLHAFSLIRKRKDPYTADLLELFICKKDFFNTLKEDILSCFTLENQYVTKDILLKLIREETNQDIIDDYQRIGGIFDFPLAL